MIFRTLLFTSHVFNKRRNKTCIGTLVPRPVRLVHRDKANPCSVVGNGSMNGEVTRP